MISAMSALKGRRARPSTATGVGAVSLQARVSPEAKIIADRAAAALGVSLAAYLDELLLRTEKETPQGMPAWVVDRIRAEQLEASQLELRESA
jgi:hypothetical protein